MSRGPQPQAYRRHVTNSGQAVFVGCVKRNCDSTNWQRACKSSSSKRSPAPTPAPFQRRGQQLRAGSAQHDAAAGGDFGVYYGGDLRRFFSDATPKTVADVCLVSDHYILLKMPDTCWRRNSQIDCIVEEVDTEDTSPLAMGAASSHRAPTGGRDSDCGTGRFAKYFYCKRNRKVSPRPEFAGDNDASQQRHGRSKAVAFECDKEVFKTRTKIKWPPRQNPVVKVQEIAVGQQKVREPETALDLSMPKPTKTSVGVGVGVDQVAQGNAFGGSPFSSVGAHDSSTDRRREFAQTSLHDTIKLEHRGCLVFPGDTPSKKPGSKSKKSKRTAPRPVKAWRWLIKPFRLRRSAREAKPKLQAVVYKTYFVRWRKAPELDEGKSKLRRCRSALF